MKNVLQHIRLEDFFDVETGKLTPYLKETIWQRGFDGDKPRIDRYFASECQTAVWAALLVFDEQTNKKSDPTKAIIPRLQKFLAYTEEMLEEMDEERRNAFTFKDEVGTEIYVAKMNRERLPYKKGHLLACYTIYYIDKSIGSVLAGNIAEATRFSFYAATMATLQYDHTSPMHARHTQQEIAAHVRHKETRQMEEEVQTHWRENMDRKPSNDEAARQLAAANMFNLSVRKMSQYISRERKKLKDEDSNGLMEKEG